MRATRTSPQRPRARSSPCENTGPDSRASRIHSEAPRKFNKPGKAALAQATQATDAALKALADARPLSQKRKNGVILRNIEAEIAELTKAGGANAEIANLRATVATKRRHALVCGPDHWCRLQPEMRNEAALRRCEAKSRRGCR